MPIPCGEYGVDKARDKARDKENHTQIPEGPFFSVAPARSRVLESQQKRERYLKIYIIKIPFHANFTPVFSWPPISPAHERRRWSLSKLRERVSCSFRQHVSAFAGPPRGCHASGDPRDDASCAGHCGRLPLSPARQAPRLFQGADILRCPKIHFCDRNRLVFPPSKAIGPPPTPLDPKGN